MFLTGPVRLEITFNDIANTTVCYPSHAHFYHHSGQVPGIDFIDCNKTHRQFEVGLYFIFKIKLSMAGGELTGRIEGVGKVLYEGQISRETISKEGPCKVVRE